MDSDGRPSDLEEDNMKKRKKKSGALLTPSEIILESISDGVFTVDLDWRVTSFNRAAEDITGVSRQEAIGRKCSDVFRSSMCGEACALQQTINTGKPVIGKSGYIIDSDGNRVPISISTAELLDAEGRVIGAAETFRDLSEVEALRNELKGKYQVCDLVSRSPLMLRIFEVLPAIASSPSTVLILGETGTGKERMARTIHSLSPRNQGPFIAVNCGALPDTPGRFALAKRGTLFLDEIGEVSPALQVRLLRVLQERTYEPLGATRSESADVRVIVATSKDLVELMRKGVFREDLYYRVNVIRMELPPLRRRKEDIPLLVEQFIQRFNRLQQRSLQGITSEALSLLMAYDWPGNIRELENAIERSFILCNAGLIGLGHLPEDLTAHGAIACTDSDARSAHNSLDVHAILSALERNAFNRLAAARDLGVHKTTLFRRMKKLGISLPDRDGRSVKKG